MEEKKLLFKITDVKKYFPVKKAGLFQKNRFFVKANDGVSIDIYEGETLGLAGESGCGKSTFGRVLLQLYPQTAGTVLYYGRRRLEFCPRYVKEQIMHFEKKWQQMRRLEKAGLVAKQAHEEKTQKQSKAQKAFEAAYFDLAHIFGGFVCVPEQERREVARAFLAEYGAGKEVCILNQRKQNLLLRKQTLQTAEQKPAQGQAKRAALRAKILKIETEIKQKTEILLACTAQIEKMRKKYSNDTAFLKGEALRDDGIDLAKLTGKEMRLLRKDMQMIFQDPYSSLNPRMTAGQIIGESLLAHHLYKENSEGLRGCVKQLMEQCGLAPYMVHRFPHQFSGGQRQRIGIARALAPHPKFVVCDEAVSALDVSIQSQIINLLQDLKKQSQLTYLFVSHDLSVIKYISDRVGIMYLGNLVELAAAKALFATPRHPYTQALLSAIPTIEADAPGEPILLFGDIPSPIQPPSGCKFHTRCRYATDVCKTAPPQWEEAAPGHFVACHNHDKLARTCPD